MLAEARDQAAHALASALILAPVALHPTPWSFALSGLLIGLVRETAQHNTFDLRKLGEGSWLDLGAGWTLGGFVLGMVF